jgi:Ca2+:H+ antiporter
VLAAVMIAANGIVGLCLLVGGVRHGEQGFQVRGAGAALAVLGALSVMTLVLPNTLVATPGPTLSPPQLVFVGVISLVLYRTFAFVQTVRHRDYFLAEGPDDDDDDHPDRPTIATALASIGLTIPVIAVVALATGIPLALGISPRDTVLLALTLLVSVLTLGTGRTTVLQGMVPPTIVSAWLFLSVVP